MIASGGSTTRVVAGILVGYVIFAASTALFFSLSGRDPHAPQSPAFMTFSIVVGVAFALTGGFIARRISRRNDNAAALGMACIVVLGALISLFASAGAGAHWSQLAALILLAPASFIGGLLARTADEIRSS